MELNELAKRIRQGDREAMAQLVKEYGGSVYRKAYEKTQDRVLAKEATRQTFQKLVESLTRDKDADPWKLYLDALADHSIGVFASLPGDVDTIRRELEAELYGASALPAAVPSPQGNGAPGGEDEPDVYDRLPHTEEARAYAGLSDPTALESTFVQSGVPDGAQAVQQQQQAYEAQQAALYAQQQQQAYEAQQAALYAQQQQQAYEAQQAALYAQQQQQAYEAQQATLYAQQQQQAYEAQQAALYAQQQQQAYEAQQAAHYAKQQKQARQGKHPGRKAAGSAPQGAPSRLFPKKKIHYLPGILLLILLIGILLWFVLGIGISIGWLPKLNLGYDWFNQHVAQVF